MLHSSTASLALWQVDIIGCQPLKFNKKAFYFLKSARMFPFRSICWCWGMPVKAWYMFVMNGLPAGMALHRKFNFPAIDWSWRLVAFPFWIIFCNVSNMSVLLSSGTLITILTVSIVRPKNWMIWTGPTTFSGEIGMPISWHTSLNVDIILPHTWHTGCTVKKSCR